MPKPIKRREFIRRFHKLGWAGPHPGKRHGLMRNEPLSVPIPNPHRGDIDWSLAKRILRQAGISEEIWNDAGK
jgi:hypothetical protein